MTDAQLAEPMRRRRQMSRRTRAAPSGGARGKYNRHALPTLGDDGESERGAGEDDEAEASRVGSAKFGARAERARPRLRLY